MTDDEGEAHEVAAAAGAAREIAVAAVGAVRKIAAVSQAADPTGDITAEMIATNGMACRLLGNAIGW